ncbi:MAG: 3-deoxy-manno-octulosonate cytidylyltransferase [Ectothiorhodospiraceae bacterium]
MAFDVIIPARYGSSRFPGKPLAPIGAWPMIRHVVERALESGADHVIVATDDERIRAACEGFGIGAVMTDPDHTSGTERLAEVCRRQQWPDDRVVVNLQGDEPFIPPVFVSTVAANLAQHPGTPMATLVTPLGEGELHDPNVVKCVRSASDHALYFSRAPIPWDRDHGGDPSAPWSGWWRHLGIYAYRSGFLKAYPELASSPLEQVESLEQLRVLWHDLAIHAGEVHGDAGPGVDTPEDVERVTARLYSPVNQ